MNAPYLHLTAKSTAQIPHQVFLEIKTKQTRQERPERGDAGDTTIWNADKTDNGTTQYRGALLEEKHEVTVSLR